MASDTQATNGNNKHHRAHVAKIWSVKGGLIGRSGSADEAHTIDPRFMDIATLEDFTSFMAIWTARHNYGDLLFIRFDNPDLVYLGESYFDKDKDRDDFAVMTYDLEEDAGIAIGSGGVIAETAMECGKTAKEAIIVASKFDIYTNDVIDTFEL